MKFLALPVPRWLQVCQYSFHAPSSIKSLHFTQLVWADTASLGCALVGPSDCPDGILDRGRRRTYAAAHMLLCEYDPPGNHPAGFEYNVLPPTTPPTICAASTGRR